MKSKGIILGLAFSLLLFTGCQNKSKNESADQFSPDMVTNPVTATGNHPKNNLPVMTFDHVKHDFGMLVQGEKVSYTFTFTNTGGSDLVISSASSTCGCTISNFSKEPVKPGAKGTVEVVFNSAGKKGTQTKLVRLLTNAQPNTVELTITAEIYIPEKKH